MNQTPSHATHPGRRALFSPLMQHRARRPLHPGTPPSRSRTDADREFAKTLRAAEMVAWEAAFPKTAAAPQPRGAFARAREASRIGMKCWLHAGLAIGAAALALRAALT